MTSVTTLRRIAILALATTALLSTIVLADLFGAKRPLQIAPEPPAHGRIASHLVVVLIDGLRYDYAIDPLRAPTIARHMKDDAHAEIWAGHVTMSSAAILAMGTGQRGDFTNVVMNLQIAHTEHNDLFANARAAGRRIALAGNPVWVQAFGQFDAQVLDSNKIALEVDNTEDVFTAGQKLALDEPRPDFLIVHFDAPDHQGHAYGVAGDRYRSFLTRFDARLDLFLNALPADTTVIGLSDHGALDSGAHGVDSPTERRSPFFAYGPGIKPGVALEPLDQIDLAETFAALLGIAAPTHGRGMAITQLLDVSPQTAAAIACADARRLLTLAAAEGRSAFVRTFASQAAMCVSADALPAIKIEAARTLVRGWDSAVDHARESAGRMSLALAGALVAGFLVAAGALVARDAGVSTARASSSTLLLGVVLASTTVVLTWLVDRVPPPWNECRAVCVALAQVPLFAALVAPSRAAAFHARLPAIATAILPGILAWSFPPNAKLHSFFALAAAAIVWTLAPHADLVATRSLAHGRRTLSIERIGFAVIGLGALLLYALGGDTPTPFPWPKALVAASLALVALWIVGGSDRDEGGARATDAAFAIVVACGAVLVRRSASWPLGTLLVVAFPLAAVVAARLGRRTLACGLAYAAYAMVSRDQELLAVAGGAIVIESIGDAFRAHTPKVASGRTRPWAVATITLVLFATVFLVRVGLQDGLDFTGIDPMAGAFGDHDPSPWRVGACIVWKYVGTSILLGWLLLRRTGTFARDVMVLSALLAVGRVGVLTITLLGSRASFWSSMRLFSDLPCAAVAVIGALLGLVALSRSPAVRWVPSTVELGARQ